MDDGVSVKPFEDPCILICGAVGSGKTSLWNLLIGDNSYTGVTNSRESQKVVEERSCRQVALNGTKYIFIDTEGISEKDLDMTNLENLKVKYRHIGGRISNVQALIIVSQMSRSDVSADRLNYTLFFKLLFHNLPKQNKFLVLTNADDQLVYLEDKQQQWLSSVSGEDVLSDILNDTSEVFFINNPNPNADIPVGRNDQLRKHAKDIICQKISSVDPYNWKPEYLALEDLKKVGKYIAAGTVLTFLTIPLSIVIGPVVAIGLGFKEMYREMVIHGKDY